MQDTSSEMQKKLFEIFFRLSPEERVKQGIEMINFGLMIVENSIREQFPDITETDFKIEKIKRLYKNDFSELELQRIIQHFREIAEMEGN